MRVLLCGASGEYFLLSDEQKRKLKKSIVKYLLSCDYDGETCRLEIKADDGFGLVATEACLEFIKKSGIVDYNLIFFCFYREDFTDMPENIQQYYRDIIARVKSQVISKNGSPIGAIDDTRGCGSRKDRIDAYKNAFTNCCCRHVAHCKRLITYLDKKSNGDKLLKRIMNWHVNPEVGKIIVDLYPASNNLYYASELTGIRKRKNSSLYYYRIKLKLPDGTPISVEKGSFSTPEEAQIARRKHLIALTTQDCENAQRTVDEIFNEFISVVCKDKPSLQKKYQSYYNTHIRSILGELQIGETSDGLQRLHYILTNNMVKDGRSKDIKAIPSNEYISALRAMLCNFYDYAYNHKYIRSHPMYALPSKWCSMELQKPVQRKEKNTFVEPLFAYSGNKHRLLPDIQGLFPKNIETFIELFGGSGVVGINTEAKKAIVNDNNAFLYGLLKGVQSTTPDAAWNLIEQIISEYNLNKTNENGYYACRDAYNSIPYEERCVKYWYWGLLLVWCSFNRSTVQFNQQGEYNAPFGFGKVNFPLAKRKFFDFAKKISECKVVFSCADYTRVTIPAGAFVYVDPPYLITTASYNKDWDDHSEQELHSYLEKLAADGVKWAMSNVLHNNGADNPTLSAWIKKNTYNVHYLKADYSHANFRRKNKGDTVEILITNY